VIQSLASGKHFVDIYKNNKALKIGHLESAFKDLFAGLEATKRSGIIVIEVPWLGGGVELSAYLTRGTMYVSNSSDLDLGAG